MFVCILSVVEEQQKSLQRISSYWVLFENLTEKAALHDMPVMIGVEEFTFMSTTCLHF